eukprot:TRINITY_DN67478_c3_g12_i1.p1 TRINITY_DN67478_c3_g12~~TRINITY_DN67478_c3_g12_i1.p1  ORF type:complete len:319 (+),score=6.55 TRINITY_DN67478_c3_g12_i1:66-1022(+)
MLIPSLLDLADANVETSQLQFDPQYDRNYVSPGGPMCHNQDTMHTSWEGSLTKPPAPPYFCPVGFYRFSLRVPRTSFAGTRIMYHGTAGHNVHRIVQGGFKPHLCQHKVTATYFTPSIIYAAHPRYAKVYRTQQGNWLQIVLECRVALPKLTAFKGETMAVGNSGLIDDDFGDNNGMEFLFKSPDKITANSGVVVTGIMARLVAQDPCSLPSSWWWTKWASLDVLHKHYYHENPKPRIQSYPGLPQRRWSTKDDSQDSQQRKNNFALVPFVGAPVQQPQLAAPVGYNFGYGVWQQYGAYGAIPVQFVHTFSASVEHVR